MRQVHQICQRFGNSEDVEERLGGWMMGEQNALFACHAGLVFMIAACPACLACMIGRCTDRAKLRSVLLDFKSSLHFAYWLYLIYTVLFLLLHCEGLSEWYFCVLWICAQVDVKVGLFRKIRKEQRKQREWRRRRSRDLQPRRQRPDPGECWHLVSHVDVESRHVQGPSRSNLGALDLRVALKIHIGSSVRVGKHWHWYQYTLIIGLRKRSHPGRPRVVPGSAFQRYWIVLEPGSGSSHRSEFYRFRRFPTYWSCVLFSEGSKVPGVLEGSGWGRVGVKITFLRRVQGLGWGDENVLETSAHAWCYANNNCAECFCKKTRCYTMKDHNWWKLPTNGNYLGVGDATNLILVNHSSLIIDLLIFLHSHPLEHFFPVRSLGKQFAEFRNRWFCHGFSTYFTFKMFWSKRPKVFWVKFNGADTRRTLAKDSDRDWRFQAFEVRPLAPLKVEIAGCWTASWQQGRTLQTDFRDQVAMLTCCYKKEKVLVQTVCETFKRTLQPTCLVQSEFEEVHV